VLSRGTIALLSLTPAIAGRDIQAMGSRDGKRIADAAERDLDLPPAEGESHARLGRAAVTEEGNDGR